MTSRFKTQLLLLFLLNSFDCYSQAHLFRDEFSNVSDYTIQLKSNVNFKEYYEITIRQPIDHSNPGNTFDQRVFVGFRDLNAPIVMVTDGYGIDYASKPDYSNELATELKANLVVVEHRFSGKPVPDSIRWKTLTLKQAAEDYHAINILLKDILKGKWLSTGISKGGQAALSYKLFYPDDVSATVVYGTAVKDKQTISTDTLLKSLLQTACGQKVAMLQLFAFKNKERLLPYFNDFCAKKVLDFKPLDPEAVFDRVLLEFPFSLWQNGNDCLEIPDTSMTAYNLIMYLNKIVPFRFFSSATRTQLEPSFYMFYHELGYYEYATAPYRQWLRQSDYSNKYFAPKGIDIIFDKSYQDSLTSFFKTPKAEPVFFIYGQNDPWALQTTVKKNVFIVPSGSHKSRISDLDAGQKTDLYRKISHYMN
jgi:hypothetical protein